MLSRSHLVLIPSFNSGSALVRTVTAACGRGYPVWVVIDGSTDGSEAAVRQGTQPQNILHLDQNGGKGAAVLAGIQAALDAGFSHALVMDADGQHSPDHIASFMTASETDPGALILGQPVFGADAPWPRLAGRRLCNALVHWEAGAGRIGDSLFGFRVYPIRPLLQVMTATRWMRGFDFDPEAAVRLCWSGCSTHNLPAPVRYFTAAEGGISHFRYLRDNLLLAGMHVRLLLSAILRRSRREASCEQTPRPGFGTKRRGRETRPRT
jgi:glycosyltransferase involved in cell wall biosynthesis